MNVLCKFTSAVLTAFVMLAVPRLSYAQTPANQLSLADARKIIEAAQKTAREMNLHLSIAVVDARGDLIAVERMPFANPVTPEFAIGKAMVSAIFGQPSADLAQVATSPPIQTLNAASGGRLTFFQGAVPIIRGGAVVGAVGAAGGTSQQDETVAKAALAAIS